MTTQSGVQTHRRRVGDTRTVLNATLKQPNESGVLTVVDLTGKTVAFSMVNAATNAVKVNAQTCTVTTAASGQCHYDFVSADVDTAGVYWGTFTVTESTETDSFPVDAKRLKIIIDSDTQTGEEAYQAAVSA